MKSIMHDKSDRTCYLCILIHEDFSTQVILEEHHAIYGYDGSRELSERFGLKVYLCPKHHRDSYEAVHGNRFSPVFGLLIKIKAQKAFEEHYPSLNFRTVFGKDYCADWESKRDLYIPTEKETEKKGVPDGFWIIEE